jgi:large subunit ribosomal protein L23
MKSAHVAITAPWFSEKAILATEKGIYAFEVPQSVNKFEIAKAVTELYKVTPRKVRIVNLPGKRVSLKTRRGAAVRAARRKAYIYLKKGETIQFA